jgi:hypothetical protein
MAGKRRLESGICRPSFGGSSKELADPKTEPSKKLADSNTERYMRRRRRGESRPAFPIQNIGTQKARKAAATKAKANTGTAVA